MTQDHYQHDKENKQTILDNIERYGYHLAFVEEDDASPGFIHTIGLYKKYGHAEIICFGLPPEVMAEIIGTAYDLIKNGETLVPGKLYPGFLEGYKIQFLKVDKERYAGYVGYAGWYYSNTFDFPLLQLVWPDKQHHFPWDKDFNPDWKFNQPLLSKK